MVNASGGKSYILTIASWVKVNNLVDIALILHEAFYDLYCLVAEVDSDRHAVLPERDLPSAFRTLHLFLVCRVDDQLDNFETGLRGELVLEKSTADRIGEFQFRECRIPKVCTAE